MTELKTTLHSAIREYLPLMLLSGFCVALLLVRVKLTQSIFMMFLLWNLFLAGTPLFTSLIIKNNITMQSKWYYSIPLLLIWLVLLPNAPYLITDFVHLNKDNAVPLWFDILLLASFTVTGLLLGLASMKNIYILLANKFTPAKANFLILFTCLLSGFGIYLGRYLRYNSWDIVSHPFDLGIDILYSLFSSDSAKAAWGITLGFGLLQFLLFDLYHSIDKLKKI